MYSNLVGEILGTCIMIAFGSGVVANTILAKSKGVSGGWMAIATGWGFAVILGIFTAQAAGAPNADLNPIVSLAKFLLLSEYSLPQLFATSIVQILGAFLGAVIVWLVYLPHWQATDNPGVKLAVFSTIPQIRHYSSNLLTEVIGTFFLIIGIEAIFRSAGNAVFPVGLGPYFVGILVWAIGLSFGGPTGYAINPARDLGPRLAHTLLPIAGKGTSDWSYAWVPIIGPILGCILGVVSSRVFFY